MHSNPPAAHESSPVPDPVSIAPPVALVSGEPVIDLPQDLYIPPDALEVFLDTFEGPLDLLLYLIKRQNLDILEIPIAQITDQYMSYIALMESMRLELAAEYLLMAAMLAEIKSRMLLPRVDDDIDDEDDPRAELIRRLQEYERIKEGAESLDILPRMQRENYQLQVVPPVIERDIPLPDLTLKELLLAFRDVAQRAKLAEHHNVDKERLSVRARMTHLLSVLRTGEFCEFSSVFNAEEGKLGVVVTLLAVLELCKEGLIDIVQSEPFAPIYLQTSGGSADSVVKTDDKTDATTDAATPVLSKADAEQSDARNANGSIKQELSAKHD